MSPVFIPALISTRAATKPLLSMSDTLACGDNKAEPALAAYSAWAGRMLLRLTTGRSFTAITLNW